MGLLTDGAVIDLAQTPAISIRANSAAGARVSSVRFGVNSTITYRMESTAPYAIAGDNSLGDYYPWVVDPGTYTVTATPYAEKNGGGTAGTPVTVTFTIRKSAAMLSGLVLVKGGTTQSIRPLTNGDVIDLSATPNINILAAPLAGVAVGSVRFGLNSTPTYRMESTAPFVIAGDVNGVYNNWQIAPGVYKIVATPYTGTNGGGTAGTPVTITVTIKQSATTLSTVNQKEPGGIVGEKEKEPWHLSAYPNPVVNSGYVEFRVPSSAQATLTLVDVSGRAVRQLFHGKADGQVLYKKELHMQGLARGVYFVRLMTQEGKTVTYRILYQ
jgi:hypothetical protein